MKIVFLNLCSFFYSLIIRLTLCLYEKHFFKSYQIKESVVISVGNLTMGGTGKSPMISWLIYLFNKQNISCGVVSRGYKRKGKKTIVVADGKNIKTEVDYAGDEPYMLAMEHQTTPIVVGNKIAACQLIQKKHKPKVILIDDGFQSLGLNRNLNILLIDLSVSFNQYFVFPRGFLREPLSGISRADVIIFTKTNSDNPDKLKIKGCVLKYINSSQQLVLESSLVSRLMLFNNNQNVFEDAAEVEGAALCFSGIARPSLFIKAAQQSCSNIIKIVSFKDHHRYKKTHIQQLKNIIKNQPIKTIITTKKDFWKIKDYFIGCKIFIIDIQHQIYNSDRFIKLLNNYSS